MDISLQDQIPPMMAGDPAGLLKLVRQHALWYPLMELRDVYKLLYQGVMGSEHLITSDWEYARYLKEEFESIHADHTERLLEPIRADRSLFRLNLRAFKSRQVTVDLLLPALLETAHLGQGSRSELLINWEAFIEFCRQKQFVMFEIETVQHFSQWLILQDYPAVHHTRSYTRAYHPSYRLIGAQFIPLVGLENDRLS